MNNPENNNENRGKAAYLNIASSIAMYFNCCNDSSTETNRNANINTENLKKVPSNSEDIDIKEENGGTEV